MCISVLDSFVLSLRLFLIMPNSDTFILFTYLKSSAVYFLYIVVCIHCFIDVTILHFQALMGWMKFRYFNFCSGRKDVAMHFSIFIVFIMKFEDVIKIRILRIFLILIASRLITIYIIKYIFVHFLYKLSSMNHNKFS